MARLPAFATLDELAEILGSNAEIDYARAQAALDIISSTIRLDSGKNWLTTTAPIELADDLPSIVVDICRLAAKRWYENPDNTRSETMGGYTYVVAGDPSLLLTADERRMIQAASGGTGGLWTMDTTRGNVEFARRGCGDDTYVDTDTGARIVFSYSPLDP